MKDNSKIFFELLRIAIGLQENISHMPNNDDWMSLYQMARKQSLVGICFATLQKLGGGENISRIRIDEALYLSWMGMAVKIQRNNEVINRQCAELQEKLSSDGFCSCILKGQGVASLYGNILQGLRQSGDIDLWVDAPRERTVEYAMSIAPTRDVNFQHVHFNIMKDTSIELHMVPVSRYNPRRNRILGKYFEKEIDRQCANKQMIGGYEMSVPTSDFQLVHQLLHVFSHYVYEGVGLRQVMDLYFAQKACTDSKRRQEVMTLFKKIGLMRFVAGTQWVLRTVFGDDNYLLCEPDKKEGERLLADILEGGNFGHYKKRNCTNEETAFNRMLRRIKQSVRMIRFDFLGMICAPWYRLRIELWRQRIGRKYGI